MLNSGRNKGLVKHDHQFYLKALFRNFGFAIVFLEQISCVLLWLTITTTCGILFGSFVCQSEAPAYSMYVQRRKYGMIVEWKMNYKE